MAVGLKWTDSQSKLSHMMPYELILNEIYDLGYFDAYEYGCDYDHDYHHEYDHDSE